MKYFVTFITIASVVLYYGFHNVKYFWLACWTSVSFYYVGLCYCKLIPGFFKKKGTIPIIVKLINAPYFILTYLSWNIYKKCINESPTNQVSDSLYIGRRLLPGEFDLDLVDYFIDLTAEFDEPLCYRGSEKYLNFPILDAEVPDYDLIKNLINKIKDSKVYLHCAQGHGRTGLIAITILMARGSVQNLSEGLNLLKSVRPHLDINSVQLKFLENFFGKNNEI